MRWSALDGEIRELFVSNLRLEDGSKVALDVAGKRLAEQELARSVKAKACKSGFTIRFPSSG